MYQIDFTETALKQFLKLPKQIQERVSGGLERVRIRPQTYLTKLVGKPWYRLKVGDYRVIVDLQHEKLLVLVIQIGHRKNVYDR